MADSNTSQDASRPHPLIVDGSNSYSSPDNNSPSPSENSSLSFRDDTLLFSPQHPDLETSSYNKTASKKIASQDLEGSYNGTAYPGQRLFVQEPTPGGEKSTRDSTVMGWSYTTVKGKVTEYTSSRLFHKDGKQPNIIIEKDLMTVIKGKGKGKGNEMEFPSPWRRFSASARLEGNEEIDEEEEEVVISSGWSMVDPDDWLMEELPRQTNEEIAAIPWRSYRSSGGSASQEGLSEASASKESPSEGSASKQTPSQSSAAKDKEFFESLLSKENREEKDTKFFKSLLAKSGASKGNQPAGWNRHEAVSSLAHPLVFDPRAPQDALPYKAFTHNTPECAALGHYHMRPKSPKPTHPLMTSANFTIIIRMVGPFDRSGRQPGLMIQTKCFTVRVLEKGFVPGERKVEIWRNGETLQLNGLIAVVADECAWFLGDESLRRGSEWHVGSEEGRKLVLGQP